MRKLYVAPFLAAALLSACSAPSQNINSNPTPASSPVAQSGTTPVSSEAVPQPQSVVAVPAPTGEKSATPVVSTGPDAKPAPSGPEPKLVVDSKINFGKQPQGKKISRNITIRNGGKALLKIDGVEPSCGCTTVAFPHEIQPGKSGAIKVNVDTGTVPGEHTKSLTIKSNDPQQPSLKVDFIFVTSDK